MLGHDHLSRRNAVWPRYLEALIAAARLAIVTAMASLMIKLPDIAQTGERITESKNAKTSRVGLCASCECPR
ncbi:hypothetical protein DMC61_11295 [Amycolatopsis sp. WAC 04169]|uniref:hypothetical protein n=1 Tax=Amycolatopsis sp. WAC 04169 TaxID=2203197 RepID=UPI000F768684|nr:hypothetical protein [Amycolatopsis sp. WAC 04169]RSN32768.1 hypothetical protein DMC61_11295 [Amycolatopsis sp. WAC 04169]